MNNEYINFGFRSVSAFIADRWIGCCEVERVWIYDISYKRGDDIILHKNECTPRRILKKLREVKYLPQESKGQLTVIYKDGMYQICNRHTDEPIFALIPMP